MIGRLEQVREYPEDADKPVITTANANDRPIAWFILSAREPSQEQMREFAQAHPDLASEIERVAANRRMSGLVMMRLRLLAEQHPEVEGCCRHRIWT